MIINSVMGGGCKVFGEFVGFNVFGVHQVEFAIGEIGLDFDVHSNNYYE